MDIDLSSSEDVQNSSHADFEARLEELLPQVAQAVAQMEVTTPEVLRVTMAHEAFRCCGRILRSDFQGDVYHKSRMSQKISTFWSHSWHGNAHAKIWSLMTFYNSRPAILLGCCSALLMMLLHIFEVLPGSLVALPGGNNSATLAGILTTALVLVLWRPRSQVFLDKICISHDAELKTTAIFSLAGFLKKSDEMLILWDPSWSQRLWCLFEFAAFLKSKESTTKKLVIRPTIISGLSIAAFAVFSVMSLATATAAYDDFIISVSAAMIFGLCSGYPAVLLLRDYFRSLDVLKEQLLSMSFDQAKCSCCEMGHMSPNGLPLICDRKVVQECVAIWFGSEAAFIHCLQKEVLVSLEKDLSGRAFTAEWALGVTMSQIWLEMDWAASMARQKIWDQTAAFVINGIIFVFIYVPPMSKLMIQICRLHRHKANSKCREIGMNLLVVFLCAIPVFISLLFFGFYQVT